VDPQKATWGSPRGFGVSDPGWPGPYAPTPNGVPSVLRRSWDSVGGSSGVLYSTTLMSGAGGVGPDLAGGCRGVGL